MLSHNNELESFYKLLELYPIDNKQATITVGKEGANNTTRYIECMDYKYVIRVYETHKDIDRVLVEHDILQQLATYNELPFQVPELLRAIDGQTAVQFPDGSGRITAISKYVEGVNPSFTNEKLVHSFGQTTGLLMNALNHIRIARPFAYKPYYEIEHSHPNCHPSFITEWCANPPSPFQDLSLQLQWISEQIQYFHSQVPYLRELPHQIIHGDLNASNVLMADDRTLNAVLDFEFATEDLRVMEVAVCLSELMVGEDNESVMWDKLNTFIKGLTMNIQLDTLEIQALPILVQLRRLDVFIHFLGRYLDGVDDLDVLRRQIVSAAAKPDWIKLGGPKLIALFNQG